MQEVINSMDTFKQLITLIIFFIGQIAVLIGFTFTILNGIKCSLRNDILAIYDRCKDDKRITHYQLQAIEYSYELYKKLKGNSFIEEIMRRIKDFEVID